MTQVEEQIKNEQVRQIAQKLLFFEELVLYIESTGGEGIGIGQAKTSRDSYKKELLKACSNDSN